MYIVDFGVYIPQQRKQVSEINEINNFSLDFMNNKLGFNGLSRKRNNETIEDMCLKAFVNLNSKISIDVMNIDIIVVVTQSANYNIPHIAAKIHNNLSIKESCMTFDISQGCAGYTYALNIVQSIISNNNYNTGLIFTCDPYSDVIDSYDKNVNMIFGDAATVTYVDSKEGKMQVIDSNFGIANNSNDCLKIEDGYLRMNGQKVFNYALKNVPKSIDELLKNNQISNDNIDRYVFHQGTKYMVRAVANKMNIRERELFCAESYGNTISSSIPIQLSQKKFNRNKHILLSGFGVGFSWGNTIIKII